MSHVELAKFILGHTWYALAAMLLFLAGALSGLLVLRWGFTKLMRFPLWLAEMLRTVLASRPSLPRLAFFIFSFNGTAMFLYLLAGVIPGAPPAIAFLTGFNVMLASILVREPLQGDSAPSAPVGTLARLCAVLTFALELPSFWYTIGMAWAMKISVLGLIHGADAAPLQSRVIAYFAIIVPILAISATVEAYAVVAASRSQEPN